MFRIVPDSLLKPEPPGKVAEGERIHGDTDRRQGARRQGSGKGRKRETEGPREPATDPDGRRGDEDGGVGRRVDFEA